MKHDTACRLAALKTMAPGQWFFVPDGTHTSLVSLRRHARQVGVEIEIRVFRVEPVYGKPGARVTLKQRTI